MSQNIITIVEKFVREEMEGLCAAHDFIHIQRVVSNAQKIHEMEQSWDHLVITIWALLHESLDEKFFKNINQRKKYIRNFLDNLDISSDQKDNIFFIIENVGFWKSLERDKNFVWSIEFQIVEDADRLEAIGAIAIWRMFSYGWKKRRPIYDPAIKPVLITDKDNYYKNADTSTSFNHFYEKLLLLKDMMHTESGKKIAEPRHKFMEVYMQEFLAEWKGDK